MATEGIWIAGKDWIWAKAEKRTSVHCKKKEEEVCVNKRAVIVVCAHCMNLLDRRSTRMQARSNSAAKLRGKSASS